MKAAFIILAHRGPDQVARLAKRLAPNYVFIHVDRNAPKRTFDLLASLLANDSHVKFITRHRSPWASWGLVAAALEGLRAALEFTDWSHVMLLSGQDYPLVSATEMSMFFNQYQDKCFVPHWILPSELWGSDGGIKRVRFWHVPFLGRRLFIPIPRRHPVGINPTGGSMYWCLNKKCASEVIDFTMRRPDIVEFYRHVWIPDELYIPSLVMNGPSKNAVFNEALTYIRWSTPGNRHPDELTASDSTELLSAGRNGSFIGGQARRKLFARKINGEKQTALLDRLDSVLIEQV